MAVPPLAATSNYGEVFTRRWVADVLLDLTGYTVDRDLATLRLIEPSCGSGAFLGPALERLILSAKAHGRPLTDLADSIRAYDLQHAHVETSRRLCRKLLSAAGMAQYVAAALADGWVHEADFLLADLGEQPADVAIGNPPYIRYDDLDEQTAREYRRRWETMRGRGDIFVGFFERCLAMLAPEGRVGFICADRWMRNQYGAPLRELVADRYAVEHVWTMHDVDAFEAQVSAYPAITVLANKVQGSTLVADTTSEFGADSAAALVRAASSGNRDEFRAPGVKAHRLPHWFEGRSFWPTGSPARLALIEHLNDKFLPLHDIVTETRVAIGIATGADEVYVTKNPEIAEPDRMLPLSMRRDLMSGTFEWKGNYLVNPWHADGRLVSLDDYPRMDAYLTGHPKLRDRFVAQKSPHSWYRTIDKVNASIIDRPKLLLQDMKATIHPVLEPGGFYPHHNLYYVVSETWDMEVLGGLLLSRIAQAFIEAYCVRMRGGTLRFQAQYLKQIRVPAQDAIHAATADALRQAFRSRDVDAATAAAGRAYDIDLAQYEMDRKGPLIKTADNETTTDERTVTVPATFDDYDAAIKAFWTGRDFQTQKQIDSGRIDAGTRGSVTGGQHLTPLQDVIAAQFEPLLQMGVTIRRSGIIPLPGFYRRAKNWDIVVMYNDVLVAAIEAKSQVGSFGNNFNNRTEEAIGNSVDLWRAYEAGLIGTIRPWLGFVMVIEDVTGSTTAVRDQGVPLYRTDQAFDQSSYTDRYRILFERLVRERLYDAACLISTRKGEGISAEPAREVSTQNLTAAIAGRVAYLQGLA